ncbi:protein of unknown function [Burkholderia multivorans]
MMSVMRVSPSVTSDRVFPVDAADADRSSFS